MLILQVRRMKWPYLHLLRILGHDELISTQDLSSTKLPVSTKYYVPIAVCSTCIGLLK